MSQISPVSVSLRRSSIAPIADPSFCASYCFPPTKDGIVKLGTFPPPRFRLLTRADDVSFGFRAAIHDRGWLSPTGPFPSLPRTILTAGYEKQQIPAAALEALRRGMARVHPSLAKKDILETRLCW